MHINTITALAALLITTATANVCLSQPPGNCNLGTQMPLLFYSYYTDIYMLFHAELTITQGEIQGPYTWVYYAELWDYNCQSLGQGRNIYTAEDGALFSALPYAVVFDKLLFNGVDWNQGKLEYRYAANDPVYNMDGWACGNSDKPPGDGQIQCMHAFPC